MIFYRPKHVKQPPGWRDPV